MAAFHRLRLAALLLSFALVVGLGAIPGQADALSQQVGDKLLHVLAYGAMAALCFHALQANALLRAVFTVGTIALLGLADESIQSLLPYRNASLRDWWFDIGTAAIVALVLLLRARHTQATESHAKN